MTDELKRVYTFMLLRGANFWFFGINVYMELDGVYFTLVGDTWSPLSTAFTTEQVLDPRQLSEHEQKCFIKACGEFMCK